MVKQQIFMALGAGNNHPRGNIWRLTAKKTDFYLDFEGPHSGGIHLSVHGPNDTFQGHRFRVRTDRKSVKQAREAGVFIEHGLGRGIDFEGLRLADDAFLVARIRWVWDLQRPRFGHATHTRTPIPTSGPGQEGFIQSTLLEPNSAWDVDIVASYGAPYWPDAKETKKDNARLGPLTNDAGMWLTASSYHRSMVQWPSPQDLSVPLPRPDQTPQLIMKAGLGERGTDDMFWFVEGVTYQELLIATAASRGRPIGGQAPHP